MIQSKRTIIFTNVLFFFKIDLKDKFICDVDKITVMDIRPCCEIQLHYSSCSYNFDLCKVQDDPCLSLQRSLESKKFGKWTPPPENPNTREF